jgi:drug/metabolite transporter (DMT)-like permease
MTATSAATVQLAVPVLASIGGVMLLAEELSLRLIIATVTVLGGVGLAVAGRKGVIRRRAP